LLTVRWASEREERPFALAPDYDLLRSTIRAPVRKKDARSLSFAGLAASSALVLAGGGFCRGGALGR